MALAPSVKERGVPRRPSWNEDPSEVLALARWLERRCEFSTVDDVLMFFACPGAWCEEYALMLTEESDSPPTEEQS